MKPFGTVGRPGYDRCGRPLELCQRPSTCSRLPGRKLSGRSHTHSDGANHIVWCSATPEATAQQFLEAPSAGIPQPLRPYGYLKQSLISICTPQQSSPGDQPTLSETGGPGSSGGGKQGGGGDGSDGWQPEDGNPFEDPDWIVSMLCVATVPAAFELVQRCLHLNGTEAHGLVYYKPCFASVAMDEDGVRSSSKETEHSAGGGGLFVVFGIAAAVGVGVVRFFKARKGRKQQAQEPHRSTSARGEHVVVQSRGVNLMALQQPAPGVTSGRTTTSEVATPQQAEATGDAENPFLQAKREKDAFFGVTSPTYATGQIRPEGFTDVKAPQAPAAAVAKLAQVKPEAVQVQARAVGMERVVQDNRSGNIFTSDMESKDRFFGSPRPKAEAPAPTDLDSKERFFGSPRPKAEEQTVMSKIKTVANEAVTGEKDNVFLKTKEEKDAFFGVTSPTYAKGQLRPEGFDDVKAPAAAPAVEAGVAQLKPDEVQVQERALGMDNVVQDTRSGNIFTADLESKDTFFGSPQNKAAEAAASTAVETPPHKEENVFVQSKEEKDAFFGVTSPTYAKGPIHPDGFGDVQAPAAAAAVMAKLMQVKPENVQVEETAVGMDNVVQDTRSGNIFTADLETKDSFFGSPRSKAAETPTSASDNTTVVKAAAIKAGPEENTFLSSKEEKDAFFGVTSPTYAKGQLRPEGFDDVKAPAAAPAVEAGVAQLKPEEVQVQERALGMDKVVQDNRSGNIFASDLETKDSFFGSPRTESGNGAGAKDPAQSPSLEPVQQAQQKAAESVRKTAQEEPGTAAAVAVHVKAGDQGTVALELDMKQTASAAEPPAKEATTATSPPKKEPKVVQATSMPVGGGMAAKREGSLQPVLEEPANQAPEKKPSGDADPETGSVQVQPQAAADTHTPGADVKKTTLQGNAGKGTPHGQSHRGRGRGRGSGKRGKK
ncbi:unnamed protein product [Ostreobium quekettii]|uniref:Uncharacterized protein n=1 Tax=Ostreobium quekettii TaxID=121088 RepID=A0A8S1ISB6_9CHLO|nr:unnamed protein product [Ostreobium quekettii]